MDFSEALVQVRLDKKITRTGWNGKGMHVEYVEEVPDERMLPFLAMQTASGDMVPWLASQTDLLATDWEVVTDEFQVGEAVRLVGSGGIATLLALYANLQGDRYGVVQSIGSYAARAVKYENLRRATP